MPKEVIITAQDKKEIESLAAYGLRDVDIAKIKGLSCATMKRHCKQELKAGRLKSEVAICNTAYKMATSGKFPGMTIFWLKTKCGWREKPRENENDKKKNNSKQILEIKTNDPIEASKVYQQIMVET